VRQIAVLGRQEPGGHRGDNRRRRGALQSCCTTARRAERTREEGSGTLNGSDISLRGSWKSGNRQFEAKYDGTFVRRHASLKGTQTWNDDGKSVSRACYGIIKRPLRAFLPREKQP